MEARDMGDRSGADAIGMPANTVAAQSWRYLEDLPVGQVFECGAFRFTADEIAAYAAAFDPRPYHTRAPPEPGAVFRQQVASGLHTLAVGFSVFVRCTSSLQSLAGICLHETVFVRPVLPEEPMRVRATWTQARPSRSRPGAGVVSFAGEVVDETDAAALRFGSTFLIRTHP
jgi:acyl dehydratase